MGMKAHWTKLEDGTWGAKLIGPQYAPSTWPGMPVTLTNATGRKTYVLLGQHLKTYRIKGGTIVAIYAIDRIGPPEPHSPTGRST